VRKKKGTLPEIYRMRTGPGSEEDGASGDGESIGHGKGKGYDGAF